MDRSKILSILASNAKAATVAGIAIVATAGGGAAVVATTVADSSSTPNSHAAAGQAQAAQNKAAALAKASADATETETDATEASDGATAQASADATEIGRPTDNHGYCVSQAAATFSPTPGSDANARGKYISGVAKSDCGKPTPTSTSSTAESKPVAKPTHSPKGQSSAHRQNTAPSHGKASPNAHATSHSH